MPRILKVTASEHYGSTYVVMEEVHSWLTDQSKGLNSNQLIRDQSIIIIIIIVTNYCSIMYAESDSLYTCTENFFYKWWKLHLCTKYVTVQHSSLLNTGSPQSPLLCDTAESTDTFLRLEGMPDM